MPNDPTRTKLKKFIDKKIKYTATINNTKDEVCILTNIKQNGKLVTDHVWFSSDHKTTLEIKQGAEVEFTATAYVYKDKSGKRKNGLHKIHNIKLKPQVIFSNEQESNAMGKARRLNKQLRRRK